MARTAFGLVLFAVLGGCGLYEPPQADPSPAILPASFTDPGCRAVARQRAEDSAVNGYDASLQTVVARDAYNNCMTMQRNRGAAAPAAAP